MTKSKSSGEWSGKVESNGEQSQGGIRKKQNFHSAHKGTENPFDFLTSSNKVFRGTGMRKAQNFGSGEVRNTGSNPFISEDKSLQDSSSAYFDCYWCRKEGKINPKCTNCNGSGILQFKLQ